MRTIVKDCYDFTNTAESGSQILSGIHATNTVFAMINTFFHTIENKQKLTTITTDSGAEMSAENGNDHTGLFNNPELENPNFKRKSMGTDYPSGKIKLRCTRSKRTIVETTLIKSNFI
ncbi:hypothetical protein [Chryseobacterium luteum]|uniref:hypothetical protein n=1 Tax=Chryseobacterium luteum TaxID=421531 RepID=UPI00103D2411|nr:hypothetical protein [Chryseobacterium luteum]